MAMSKVGPWSLEDYESFIALATEPPPPPPVNPLTLGGFVAQFLESTPSGDKATLDLREFVKNEWSVRRNHPVYQWLQKNQDFRDAWAAFERIQRRPGRQPSPLKLASPEVGLIFLREFVRHAGWAYMLGGSKRSNYGATAGRRLAAARHAKDLKRLLTEGVSLHSYSDTQKLMSLLGNLMEQLVTTRRKSYGGLRERARAIQKLLARALITDCGLKSPSVVESFARMVGAPCDLKTAQRYCDEQEKQWRRQKTNALAKALRETDKNRPTSA